MTAFSQSNLEVGDFVNSKIFPSLDGTSIFKMEVFEFRLALCEMSTAVKLYRGQTLEEREEALRLNDFLDLSRVKGLGGVISQCWNSKFHSHRYSMKHL